MIRKGMTLETKVTILKHHEGGEGVNAIALSLGLPQLSVSTVLKNATNIKKAGETCTTLMEQPLSIDNLMELEKKGLLMKKRERKKRNQKDDWTSRHSVKCSAALITP
ncbi:hypothetical protein Pcinc_003234 [Petrolisthes cinctipes]|uniref:HTH psq-type domain-containing protein n=1 Tax=Petrolisthes cinctipes TaxID=88211 RepID=A0AAE1L273_PETCI|nr:hypothetical protein Pcinc_003234 [Petrolisthes cinctipes]